MCTDVKRRLDRREFLQFGGASVAAGAILAACGGSDDSPPALERPNTADAALARLVEGNRRFANGALAHPHQDRRQRDIVAGGQRPWALVWACIDSRVTPEIIFDQGLGDLFVVRTAGQAIDAVSLGSAEFGAAEFELPLVVILGHERCGAVTAAIEALEKGTHAEGQIGSIVSAIRPAYEAAGHGGDVVANTVLANVRLQLTAVRSSPVFAPLVTRGSLRVVGAVYDLDTSLVDFSVGA